MPGTDIEPIVPNPAGADVFASFMHAITPLAFKALSRLVAAGADYPAAWLERWTDGVRTKTESRRTVEGAVANAVAATATENEQVVERAMHSMLRKEYRSQVNREAVAVGTAKLLADESTSTATGASQEQFTDIDDDWFNNFERYAEIASTERMQDLWSRVLAGEIRRPGSYSIRTLRCLSEMSQADAMTFAELSRNCIAGFIATSLFVKPRGDITPILELEAAGVINGSSGDLIRNFSFNDGSIAIRDGDYVLQISGPPGGQVQVPAYLLTPVGQELMTVISSPDRLEDLRRIGNALRPHGVLSAQIRRFMSENNGAITSRPLEVLWEDKSLVTVPTINSSS